MATAVKRKFSGSTDGKPVKIVATSTPGTALHTAVAGIIAGTFDEIWLWAFNSYASPVLLTVEFGGATVPDQNISVALTSLSGLVPIVPGLILQNGATVKAFAGIANVVTVSGFVNSTTD